MENTKSSTEKILEKLDEFDDGEIGGFDMGTLSSTEKILKKLDLIIEKYVPHPYFTFEFYEENGSTPTNGSITVKYTTTGEPLQYSLDNANTWEDIDSNGIIESINNKILMRGKGRDSLFIGQTPNNAWVINAPKVFVKGNINNLLDYENPPEEVGAFCFNYMFFSNTNLQNAPDLPATKAGKQAYGMMFYRCYNMKTSPVIKAKEIGEGCFGGMFAICESIKEIPEFNFKTLTKSCFANTFSGCISIEKVKLNIEMLAQDSCVHMFMNCSSLKSVEVNFTAWPDTLYTSSWLQGTSVTGEFIKPTSLPEVRGDSNIPNGWTITNK